MYICIMHMSKQAEINRVYGGDSGGPEPYPLFSRRTGGLSMKLAEGAKYVIYVMVPTDRAKARYEFQGGYEIHRKRYRNRDKITPSGKVIRKGTPIFSSPSEYGKSAHWYRDKKKALHEFARLEGLKVSNLESI